MKKRKECQFLFWCSVWAKTILGFQEQVCSTRHQAQETNSHNPERFQWKQPTNAAHQGCSRENFVTFLMMLPIPLKLSPEMPGFKEHLITFSNKKLGIPIPASTTRALHKLHNQFSSVAQSCPSLCDPMACSRPGPPVHHQLPELAQTHVHWVSDVIQQSHLLSPTSPPTLNLSQHPSLFQGVSSLHQVAKLLEFQLQHQFFQWIFSTDLL